MNILITGGAGNIGGSLAMRLREEAQYLSIDNLSTSSLTGLDLDRIDFHNANVNENQGYLQYVFDECKPDLVFHFAACIGIKLNNIHFQCLETLMGLGIYFTIHLEPKGFSTPLHRRFMVRL